MLEHISLARELQGKSVDGFPEPISIHDLDIDVELSAIAAEAMNEYNLLKMMENPDFRVVMEQL